MNANTSHVIKRTIYLVAFGICLTLVAETDASAHTVDFRPGFAEVRYVHSRARSFPGWLRRNRDFQHWYWHSRYRFKRHLNWHRLYHIYLLDRRHRRPARVVYDDHYYDHGYRSYYKKRYKRKY
jgi:hypothetical protein